MLAAHQKGPPMQNTRNSTQVTKVSQLLKYVDLTGQLALLVCSMTDITGSLPSSVRVVLAVSAVVHVGMRR